MTSDNNGNHVHRKMSDGVFAGIERSAAGARARKGVPVGNDVAGGLPAIDLAAIGLRPLQHGAVVAPHSEAGAGGILLYHSCVKGSWLS